MLAERPALIALGLAGFLSRGGLVLFVLPIVVLPTTVGMSNWIGPAALTASGPTEALAWRLAVIAAIGIATFVAGMLVGVVCDVALFGEARSRLEGRAGPGPAGAGRPEPRPGARLILRIGAIRLVALIPVAAAAGLAANRVVAVTYHELILPDELVTPLVLRVIIESRDALFVVALAWLASETFGGLAVRHYLVRGSLVSALGRPFADLVLRPATTLGTMGVGLGGAVVAVAPPLLLAWLLWNRLRQALLIGEPLPLAVLTMGFVALWLVGLAAAGTVASWRSLVSSFDVLRARGETLPAAPTVAPPPPSLPLAPAPLEPVGGQPAT